MNSMDYSNDPRAVLIHFNPNHDRLGRFAKNHFGGSRASKPIDKNSDKGYNKKERAVNNSSNAGKFVKIGAAVAISALAAYGGYTLYKSGALDNYIDSGRSMLNNVLGKRKTGTASNFGPEVTPHFSGISDWNISDFTKSLQGSFPNNQKPNSQNVKPVTEAVKGLKKLTKPESITEVIKHANPHQGEKGYEENCTRCAIATFLRRKGFDVSAGKMIGGHGDDLIEVAEKCFKIPNHDKNVVEGYATYKNFYRSKADAAKMLVERFGNNAEGVVGIKWRDDSGQRLINGKAGGHAFNWRIKDGIVTFFDGQGKDGRRDDDFISKKFFNIIDPDGHLRIIRLDQAEPIIENILKYVE